MDKLQQTIERIRLGHPQNPGGCTGYKCPECMDVGWVLRKDGSGNDYAERCACWGREEARRLMRLSGVSPEFQGKGFENFNTGNHPQLVNAKSKSIGYLESFREREKTRHNSIMFCGQVGSGKTHLGIAVCNKLMDQNIAVSYMAYRNAITRIKQVMTDEAEYNRALRPYIHARVLYIDDLLKGRVTESDVNILYEIVNYRYMNSLPLIISTEQPIEGLIGFDEAIGSRIVEMCRGNIVQLHGKDLNYRMNRM